MNRDSHPPQLKNQRRTRRLRFNNARIRLPFVVQLERFCLQFRKFQPLLVRIQQNNVHILRIFVLIEHAPGRTRRKVTPLALRKRRIPALDDELTLWRPLFFPNFPPIPLNNGPFFPGRPLLVLRIPLTRRQFLFQRFQFTQRPEFRPQRLTRRQNRGQFDHFPVFASRSFHRIRQHSTRQIPISPPRHHNNDRSTRL